MSKHTPGQWVAAPDPNGGPDDYCIGLDDDCSPVDYVAVCSKRDASVIAAAPEMLATLQWLDRIGGLGLEVHRVISAAIAKAEGQ